MAPRKSEKEKELADRERLTRMWRRYHAEQLEQALAGIYSDVMKRLMAQLEDLRSARALVDFIAAQDWESVDVPTRAPSRCSRSTVRSPRCASDRNYPLLTTRSQANR